jgi:hypothetical protein
LKQGSDLSTLLVPACNSIGPACPTKVFDEFSNIIEVFGAVATSKVLPLAIQFHFGPGLLSADGICAVSAVFLRLLLLAGQISAFWISTSEELCAAAKCHYVLLEIVWPCEILVAPLVLFSISLEHSCLRMHLPDTSESSELDC